MVKSSSCGQGGKGLQDGSEQYFFLSFYEVVIALFFSIKSYNFWGANATIQFERESLIKPF
ncbi:hypothetical protein AWN67_11260 [Streptococcus pneumoniae]|nr:hypothetical protein AWN67_11260 [Streptococcus pneumoniae]